MDNLIAIGLAILLLMGLLVVIPARVKGIIALMADGMFIYSCGYDSTYGFYFHNLSTLGQLIALAAGVLGLYWLFISGSKRAHDGDPALAKKTIQAEHDEDKTT